MEKEVKVLIVSIVLAIGIVVSIYVGDLICNYEFKKSKPSLTERAVNALERIAREEEKQTVLMERR